MIRHFVRDRKGRFDRLEDPPGGSDIDEYVDINNRGDAVGFYNDDKGATTTGFLRTKRGRFVDIVFPGSVVSGPLKINDRRQVVGIYADRGGTVHGFLWDDARFRTIDVPRASNTLLLGINNRGQMVGSYIDAEGGYHGFLRERNGRVRTLPEAPGTAPTMGGTQPAALNDRGQVVGVAYDARGGSRAFRFERGVLTQFDGPGAVYTRALDINNRGEVIGDYGTRAQVASASAQKYIPPNCPPVTFSTWPCT